MTSTDLTFLKEAYISATQKAINVLPSMPQPDEQETLPVILTPTNEPNYEDEDEDEIETGCGCGGGALEEPKESEELFMAKSNLFSIFCHAKKIHKFCEGGVSLDPWMIQKIAVCADNLESVFRSCDYDASRNNIDCE